MSHVHSHEIEIKSLLGSAEAAHSLKLRMEKSGGEFRELGSHRQLNHYFTGGNLKLLPEKLKSNMNGRDAEKLEELAGSVSDYSLRTRLADGKLLLVLKASITGDSSANAVERMEFEGRINGLTLEELDKAVLNCGFGYQSKWSREREEYEFRGIKVTIDKNAGYGYVAEFEFVVNGKDDVSRARRRIEEVMGELGVKELPQERLRRMFAYYNAHWPEYYGTDKTFVVE